MSNPRIDHKCNCKTPLSDQLIISGENVYHSICEGFLANQDDVILVKSLTPEFMNLKKYDLGDKVLVNDYEYFVDSVYDDGVAETLICDCDTNCKDRNGYPALTCFNCQANRRRLDDDEDGNADWEWVNGFTDKMTIINEPEIKINMVSLPTQLKVRIA